MAKNLFVVRSTRELVRVVATNLLTKGYRFYVQGEIPERKDPLEVDRKLIKKYDLDLSRWQRARRKQQGRASVRYLRLGRKFIMLATPGEHRWFEEERAVMRDARRSPIRIGGYAIGLRRDERVASGWRVRVAIERETFRDLKAHFQELARTRSASDFERALEELPFEPFAAVRRQLKQLCRLHVDASARIPYSRSERP